MKRVVAVSLTFGLLVLPLLVSTGCKKKPQAVSRPPSGPSSTDRPAPVTGPAPTIQLTASPSSIQRGEETTLSWQAKNAEAVVIDSGVGNVAASGSLKVSPDESVTYTATASGAGGEAKSSARVTVLGGTGSGDVRSTDIEGLQQAIDQGLVRPVFFAYDKAELRDDSKRILEENARWFRRFPNVGVTVEGHCDERGTEEYNLALGDRRAQVTRDYLIQLGVDAGQLEAISFGEERPFVEGHDETAWAQNRRAHFSVR